MICNPFGYEAVCAHGSLRAFADTCAAAGMPALRFDYSGTGDSSGPSGEGDQISRWCDDIRAAIEMLERTCGVRRVCLVGVRLGALLAGVVATQREVDAIIAVAPVTNGRRYVRELRAFRAGASIGGSDSPAPSEKPDAAVGDGLDITGFPLSQLSVERLNRMELAGLSERPRTAALILDRDDLPGAQAWSTALEAAGVRGSLRGVARIHRHGFDAARVYRAGNDGRGHDPLARALS
ncbi:MAG: alpha/beta hydrolase [Gammaproteobacteria bacterium]